MGSACSGCVRAQLTRLGRVFMFMTSTWHWKNWVVDAQSPGIAALPPEVNRSQGTGQKCNRVGFKPTVCTLLKILKV